MSTEYTINGMTCNHCVKTVENEFKKLGIIAKADLATNRIETTVILDEASYQKLKMSLEDLGYELGNKV